MNYIQSGWIVTISFVDLFYVSSYWCLNLKYLNQYALCKLGSNYVAVVNYLMVNMGKNNYFPSVGFLLFFHFDAISAF